MATHPLVSVIIPVKNSAKRIARAVQSVVDQAYPNLEILIVDGQSTDNTLELAATFPRVRIMQQPGRGLADAWNAGLETAAGAYITFLDSDDWWAEGKLETQIGLLEQRPDRDYVIGRVRFFVEPGTRLSPKDEQRYLSKDHTAYIPGSLAARRSLFDRIGSFPMDMDIAIDTEWFFRAKDLNIPMEILPRVVLHKSIHDTNLSMSASGPAIAGRELVRVARESIGRQKRGQPKGAV